MAFPSGWNYKRQISIASGQKSESPTGIVLTITEASGLADANGPLDADGTAPAQNGGGDLRVSSDSAGTSQIPLDVVSFVTDNDHTAAKCELKVNFDDLSSDAFYLWWGTEGTESQPAVTDPYGRNAVYSSGNHVLAYSMDEDPSGSAPQLTDRTGNGNDGTSSGSMTSGDVVAGQLGSSIDFDGSNDYINAGSDSSLYLTSSISISLWVYLHTLPAGNAELVTRSISAGSSGSIEQNYWLRTTASGKLQLGWSPADNDYVSLTTNSIVLSANTWHHIGVTHQWGTTASTAVLVDGVSEAFTWSGDGTREVWTGGTQRELYVGVIRNTSGAIYNYVDGLIDQVAIRSSVLTSADDTTLYNCESDNAAFWSVGSVESVGGGGFGAYLAAASRSSRTLCGSRL